MNEHLGEGTSAQVLVHSSMNMGKYGRYRMKQLTTGATTETVSSRHLLRVEYGKERITVIIIQAKATGQTKTMSFFLRREFPAVNCHSLSNPCVHAFA